MYTHLSSDLVVKQPLVLLLAIPLNSCELHGEQWTASNAHGLNHGVEWAGAGLSSSLGQISGSRSRPRYLGPA